MRIKSLSLCWFRGAAEKVDLSPVKCKSIVVYGCNGAGKSSFVDAVEYILNERVEHLAHEYSGKRQEKGIVNTHTPENQTAQVRISFDDDTSSQVAIQRNGSSQRPENADLSGWKSKRSVLRQHELSEFIQSTKSQKYSALLPLLGLAHLEHCAENLKNLAKQIAIEGRVEGDKVRLQERLQTRRDQFEGKSDVEIFQQIEELCLKYALDLSICSELISRCKLLKSAIDNHIRESTAEQREFIALKEIVVLDIRSRIVAVRQTSAELSKSVEPLVSEKLDILESAGRFAATFERNDEICCPACGRTIKTVDFHTHVKSEQARLKSIKELYARKKSEIGFLCDDLNTLKRTLNKADLKQWRHSLSSEQAKQNIARIVEYDVESLRSSMSEKNMVTIEDDSKLLITEATKYCQSAPPDAQQLSDDKQCCDAAMASDEAKDLQSSTDRVQSLIEVVQSLEAETRKQIKDQAQQVIDEISEDMKSMWSVLHPEEPITDVKLSLPDGDKAIDVSLKFYGVEQDSPRLTLSEGHRNSLGLCIFLAMAKQKSAGNNPLILDDVVISLDRGHRGMIAEVLRQHFNDRQLIILTHDRDWYAELKVQLDGKDWDFKALRPYENPELGIRWSEHRSSFNDARSFLETRPDTAGNEARKIMDSELAIIAEKLGIKFPYLRGEKNEKRMSHEFLERICSAGEKCFQMNTDEEFVCYKGALDKLKSADRLIVSWGNRASHSNDVVKPEAKKLIEECETALGLLKQCPTCQKHLWYLEKSGNWFQCECGKIRWRYDKD